MTETAPAPPVPHVSRRRAICLFASTVGASSLARPALATPPALSWEGTALGGDASLTVDGFPAIEAQNLIDQAIAELLRLEQIFSLHRPTSDISRLNRSGKLENAPEELLDALRLSADLYRLSGGRFDPTVQPLWERQAHMLDGSEHSTFKEVRQRIGFQHVDVSGDTIRLHNDAQITLNGIAQGIITDKIALIFKEAGAQNTLINMGEFCVTGPKPDGSAWSIGLRDPASVWNIVGRVPLRHGAMATSAQVEQQTGKRSHLFDPLTGTSPEHYTSVSVIAPNAALADGLSTTLFALSIDEAIALVERYGQTAARFMLTDGRLVRTSGWRDLKS